MREKLIKIGAKVVRHGRYITFQMAEVAIPRTLFAEILRLVDGLPVQLRWLKDYICTRSIAGSLRRIISQRSLNGYQSYTRD